MEKELVSGSDTDGPPVRVTFSVSKLFDEHLPYYLAIGMPYDLYWRGDVEAARAYRKAHELAERRAEYDRWKQGLYFYEALLDCSPILHAFAKSGTKPIPYPSEPYPATRDEVAERENRKQREEYEKQQEKIKKWMINANRKLEEKEGTDDG